MSADGVGGLDALRNESGVGVMDRAPADSFDEPNDDADSGRGLALSCRSCTWLIRAAGASATMMRICVGSAWGRD